jgi:Tat protein translocase TatB subunit
VNFFGVGLLEILLILVIALLVVGPHRLPETAAQLGRTVRTIRRYAGEVTSQVREELADLEAEYEAMKKEAEHTRQSIGEATSVIESEAKTIEEDIDRSATDINRTIQGEPSSPAPTSNPDSPDEEKPVNVVPLDRRDQR